MSFNENYLGKYVVLFLNDMQTITRKIKFLVSLNVP